MSTDKEKIFQSQEQVKESLKNFIDDSFIVTIDYGDLGTNYKNATIVRFEAVPMEDVMIGDNFFKESKPNKTVNYIVHIHHWGGSQTMECETEQEAWDIIGSYPFGTLYEVESPTGKDVEEFIPF